MSKVISAALVIASLSSVLLASGCGDGGGPAPAKSMDATTDPVAVISPLPETISNGTRYELNATDSYDYNGTLVGYVWEIVHGDDTWYLYGSIDYFWFRDEGLYRITLTVEDLWGNTDDAFTAVISVDDSDFDGMPDWWEMAYFDTLGEEPADDYEGDGYSNLREYADGTDPTVVDPPETGFELIQDNWVYIAAIVAAAVAAAAALYVRSKRRQKEREEKKIEIAIELEKSLDEE
ncbi:MAG: PKD domain-containing protein [Candidatus Thermoplasmatota archaeon]